MMRGAACIVETDDDNTPYPDFIEVLPFEGRMTFIEVPSSQWLNVYSFFSEEKLWPRGFPLEHVGDVLRVNVEESTVICPIRQGLADLSQTVVTGNDS